MANPSPQSAAMLGGTLCSIFFQFPLSELLDTVVLATIGAIVSYLVTLLLQRWRK